MKIKLASLILLVLSLSLIAQNLTAQVIKKSENRSQIINVTEEQLFNAYKQDRVKFAGWLSRFGGGGNCASVALIKAAIGTFGINGVFKDVRIDETAKIVYVTRRDDEVIELTFDRLEFAKKYFYIASIKQDDISQKIADYSRFCFAVMSRAKQLDLGYNRKRFYRAVDNLNKGEPTIEIHKLLGLEKEQISDLSYDNLGKYKNIVLWNSPHAVYSSSGNYDEFFRGTETGIEPLSRLGDFHCRGENDCPILGAYTLK